MSWVRWMSAAKALLDASMGVACLTRGQRALGVLFLAYAVGDVAAGLISR